MRSHTLLFLPAYVAAHGAMITPAPRSSHDQVLDDRNKCGSQDPYSKAGFSPGEYCGLGCIGESCLYYQIGCFQSCGTCSYTGKTLYPVAADLVAAGCQEPPPPTLGGGDPAEEHKLRTYNIDNDSRFGDWGKWNPWRSPGTAGKGNPKFQPCGVNSGGSAASGDPPAAGQPIFANGTDLPALKNTTTWAAGSVVEASWSIYANHGGGYSYRLCKKDGSASGGVTEECYQQTPLDFATDTTEIRYVDGSRAPFLINATTTDKGTWPVGSQWRKNPIPMCGCDIGTGCGGKKAAVEKAAEEEEARGRALFAAKLLEGDAGGKQCKAVLREFCGNDPATNTCLKCGTKSEFDCEECCPGLTRETSGDYAWCDDKSPKTCSKENPRSCYQQPYDQSHFHPGQTSAGECTTGVMFETSWDDGAGAGIGGNFMFEMVDKIKIPDGLAAGEYSISWRWDCEQTPQVWNSCADVTIA